MLGGWKINENLKELTELPQPLASAFSKGSDMLKGYTGLSITPIGVLAEQIVNGTNYLVLCKTSPIYPNATESLQFVIVNASFDKKTFKIVSFEKIV